MAVNEHLTQADHLLPNMVLQPSGNFQEAQQLSEEEFCCCVIPLQFVALQDFRVHLKIHKLTQL